jgi:hypothetical protein
MVFQCDLLFENELLRLNYNIFKHILAKKYENGQLNCLQIKETKNNFTKSEPREFESLGIKLGEQV